MQVYYFYDAFLSVYSNLNATVFKNERLGYWTFDEGSLKIDWSLCFKDVYRHEDILNNSLIYKTDNNEFFSVRGDEHFRESQLPVKICSKDDFYYWGYRNEVWIRGYFGNTKKDIKVYNPQSTKILEFYADKFHYADTTGCVFTTKNKLIKLNYDDNTVWELELNERHNVFAVWHEKRLMMVPDATAPDFKVIHLDTGQEIYSWPLVKGLKKFIATADLAYFFMGHVLYVLSYDQNTFNVLNRIEYEPSLEVDKLYLLKKYLVVITQDKHIFVIDREGYLQINKIEVSVLAKQVTIKECNEDGTFLDIGDNDIGCTRIAYATIEELLNSDQLQLTEEFLNCQTFTPEPDLDRPGLRVRVVCESDLDVDTLCRHLPIGLFRAAYEYGTCLGPGYVEDKYELPDFNGTIFVDLSEYTLADREIDLLTAYIEKVHSKIDFDGYGTPDKKRVARVKTNYPGLFDQ
ncbi:hypothetical protein [Gynuella sunshinyii]|uniref:Uncharacterized protein n=1 Tax=Gynuella sunshinyii YC6258 TaxID=1445510 RepID=A0A0C5VFB6_9GAMM|nr:hypothetical protein [Gynuella sunshinyii]AJQ92851.1 hypothetical Protein YC6258_00801 [Gynuella sunshinyii YC6258]